MKTKTQNITIFKKINPIKSLTSNLSMIFNLKVIFLFFKKNI